MIAVFFQRRNLSAAVENIGIAAVSRYLYIRIKIPVFIHNNILHLRIRRRFFNIFGTEKVERFFSRQNFFEKQFFFFHPYFVIPGIFFEKIFIIQTNKGGHTQINIGKLVFFIIASKLKIENREQGSLRSVICKKRFVSRVCHAFQRFFVFVGNHFPHDIQHIENFSRPIIEYVTT